MESEALNKITARYNFREDRITIDGVIHTGQQLQMVLTQRLARAIVLELVRHVSVAAKNAMMNDFAQELAVLSREQSEPVDAKESHNVWLVTHLHVQPLHKGTRLIFTEDNKSAVHVNCTDAVLRNLIDIIYKSFVAGDWPLDIFPDWVCVQTLDALPPNIMN